MSHPLRKYSAVIFDLDGTLTKGIGTYDFYPEALSLLGTLPTGLNIGIATNQGAPTLRAHILRTDPQSAYAQSLPTEEGVIDRVKIIERMMIGLLARPVHCRVALAYERNGEILPPIDGREDSPWHDIEFRKPNRSMGISLLSAMGVNCTQTLCIGDKSTDKEFAANLGCDFLYAQRWFESDYAAIISAKKEES